VNPIFFVQNPTRRSQCLFLPNEQCIIFDNVSNDGWYKFFCNKDTTAGMIIVPPTTDASAAYYERVTDTIRAAWHDASTTIDFQRMDDAFFTPNIKPCDGCELLRRAHVIVIDVSESITTPNGQRIREYVQMANTTLTFYEIYRNTMLQNNGTLPDPKRVLLIGNGIPPFMTYAERAQIGFFDYSTDGEADFDKLYDEMYRIADQPQFASVLDMSGAFDDFNDPVDMRGDFEDDQESLNTGSGEDEELPGFKFYGTEPINSSSDDDESIPAYVLLIERYPSFERFAALWQSNARHDFEKRFPELVQVETHIANNAFLDAVIALYRMRTIADTEANWRELRDYTAECLALTVDKLTDEECIDAFFRAVMRPGASLSWSKGGGYIESLVTVSPEQDTRLNVRELPVRHYSEECTGLDLHKWVTKLRSEGSSAAFYSTSVPTADNLLNIARVRVEQRDNASTPFYLIELELPKVRRCLKREQTIKSYLREEIDLVYGGDSAPPDPFSRMYAVSSDDEFFGQKALLALLARHLEGRQNFILVGRQLSGKTSVIKRLIELSKQQDPTVSSNYLMLYLELQRPTADVRGVYLDLVRQIMAQLNEFAIQNGLGESSSFLPRDLRVFQLNNAAPLEEIHRQFIDDIRTYARRLHESRHFVTFDRLVLLIDEFDRLFTRRENSLDTVLSQDEIARVLDAIRQIGDSEQITIGLVSLGGLLMLDKTRQLTGRFHVEHLTSLDAAESADMMTRLGVNYLLLFDDDAHAALFEATGGDPYLIRRMANAVYRHTTGKGGMITAPHLAHVITGFQHSSTDIDFVRRIYQTLRREFDNESRLIEALALAAQPLTVRQLSNDPALRSSNMGVPEIKQALGTLQKMNLVTHEPATDAYRIRIGLLGALIADEI